MGIRVLLRSFLEGDDRFQNAKDRRQERRENDDCSVPSEKLMEGESTREEETVEMVEIAERGEKNRSPARAESH